MAIPFLCAIADVFSVLFIVPFPFRTSGNNSYCHTDRFASKYYGIVVSLWLTLTPGLSHSSSSVLLSAVLTGKMHCARMSVEENAEALGQTWAVLNRGKIRKKLKQILACTRSSQGPDVQSWSTNFLTEEKEDQQKCITELNRCHCRTVQELGSVPCPKCFSPTWDAIACACEEDRKRTVTSWQEGHLGVVRIYWGIIFFSGGWQWSKILTKVLVRHY